MVPKNIAQLVRILHYVQTRFDWFPTYSIELLDKKKLMFKCIFSSYFNQIAILIFILEILTNLLFWPSNLPTNNKLFALISLYYFNWYYFVVVWLFMTQFNIPFFKTFNNYFLDFHVITFEGHVIDRLIKFLKFKTVQLKIWDQNYSLIKIEWLK